MIATNNPYGIEISHLRTIDGGYQFKLSVTTIGMYIFGFTARPSKQKGSEWWVQSPAHFAKGRWVKAVEFDTKTDFWTEVEKSCSYAIQMFNEDEGPESTDPATGITASDLDKALEVFGIDTEDQAASAVSWRSPGEKL